MIKVQRRINSVHTQEQKKEVFKNCQKEMKRKQQDGRPAN